MIKNIFSIIKKVFQFYNFNEVKEHEQEQLDKIMELSMSKNLNNTDHFFVLDYNSLSMPPYNSKTNYSDLLNTTIHSSNEDSLNEMQIEELKEKEENIISNHEMSSLDISNTLSEWNTVMDLSKTIK